MKKVNSVELTKINGLFLNKKYFLKKLHQDFYKNLLENVPTKIDGHIIELGCGAGFLKKINKRVVTSDVLKLPGIDKVFPAENIPFSSNTVKAFLGLNVLHHIKNPAKAFKEMERCLKIGGIISFIEPSNTFWSRFIYKNFHHELFDEKADWISNKKDPLYDSNIALPWIIFFRDIGIFKKKFPNLIIKSIKIHTPLAYLVSGGLRNYQLLPNSFYNFVRNFEKIFSDQGMFMTITIIKK